MLTITADATEQIKEILLDEQAKFVRAFVQGGGCSGFSYGFTIEEEQAEDDFVFDNVLVDVMSMQYLQGATIDYKKNLMGSQFVVTNPNAKHTCGCGSSFTV